MSFLNIWDKQEFRMCGIGKKCKPLAWLKHFGRCLKWSKQRIVRGYADCDVWDMRFYLQKLIPDMLETLRDTRHGSPACLGQNHTDENGILVNDDCHEEWTKILNRMIFLWRESDEDTCTQKNQYDEEHTKAFSEFTDKYGLFGEALETEEEKAKNGPEYHTLHMMSELPEYQEIDEKYMQREKELAEYREDSQKQALDMMKQWMSHLWD